MGDKDEDDDNDLDYDVDGKLDGVCGLNAADTPQPGSLVRSYCSFAQVVRDTLHEDHCYLDSCSPFHQVFTMKYLSDVTRMLEL